MAQTKYSYVKAVHIGKLSDEIAASAIVHALDYIDLSDTALDIYMKDAISAGDKTILDGLVTAHDATPPEEVVGTIDIDGDHQFRIKEAKKGWHVQPHFVNLRTSDIGQELGEYDKDLSPLGWSSLLYYKDVDGTLTATTDVADTDKIVATVLNFSPPWDYEVKSGEIKVLKTPTDPCCLFPVGVPDIPASSGGSKPFATGGIDLRFIESGHTEIVESLASKYMPRQTTGLPDGWTNKIQLYLRHHPGIKVDIQFKFGLLAE